MNNIIEQNQGNIAEPEIINPQEKELSFNDKVDLAKKLVDLEDKLIDANKGLTKTFLSIVGVKTKYDDFLKEFLALKKEFYDKVGDLDDFEKKLKSFKEDELAERILNLFSVEILTLRAKKEKRFEKTQKSNEILDDETNLSNVAVIASMITGGQTEETIQTEETDKFTGDEGDFGGAGANGDFDGGSSDSVSGSE